MGIEDHLSEVDILEEIIRDILEEISWGAIKVNLPEVYVRGKSSDRERDAVELAYQAMGEEDQKEFDECEQVLEGLGKEITSYGKLLHKIEEIQSEGLGGVFNEVLELFTNRFLWDECDACERIKTK